MDSQNLRTLAMFIRLAGRQGTTFLVTVGGQFLGSWNRDYQIDVIQGHFSGNGIQATLRKDIRPLTSPETEILQE